MLSVTSKYALRALVHLARHHGEDTSMHGRELAEQTRIPPQYLSKVMLTLKKAGLVTTARGTGGGYRLARPTKEIPLAEVLALFEGGFNGSECLLGVNERCSASHPCTAHAAWGDLRDAYVGFFRTTTLADISGALQPVPQGGAQ